MNDTFWEEESSVPSSVCKKRKRRVGKRKIEFIGWGSRPLIEFLEAIGKDTREKHSRQEVAAFISKYIIDKSLTSAEKKKKVICDERLFALFGKKIVPRIKVYDMLDEHFAENHDDSDDDSLDSSDEDYGEKKSFEMKKNPTGQTKKALKTPKSCFAAIIPENIKLIYLKRSVVQELLKFPESFEFKLVGSFVRIKSDPNDIYQKNRFQLQQVTGLVKVSVAGDADTEIHLRVSNFFKDVPIPMLLDDNFSEEEVEDVRDRIKAGLLNRLTVNELQLKAKVLHADITKNWIAKEISLLQKRAEHANEKGWQREKIDYLERRKMLQKPCEQEKLLCKLPEVIAEELEPEVTVADGSEKAEAEVGACSPKSILRESSDVSSTDASGSGEIGTPPNVSLGDSHALKAHNGSIDGVVHVPLKDPLGDSHSLKVKNRSIDGVVHVPRKDPLGDSHALQVQNASIDGAVHVPLKDPLGDSHSLQVQNGSIDGAVHIPLKAPIVYRVEQGKLVPVVTYGESSREMQGADSGKKHLQGEPEQPLRTTGVIAGPNAILDGRSRETQQVMDSGEKGLQGEAEQRLSTITVIYDESSREMQGAGSKKKHPQGEPEHPLRTTRMIVGPNAILDGRSRETQQVMDSGEKGPQGMVEQRSSTFTVIYDENCREMQDPGSERRHPQGEPEHPLWTTGVVAGPNVVIYDENCREMQGPGYERRHPQGEPEHPLWTTGVVAGPNAVIYDENCREMQGPVSEERHPQGEPEHPLWTTGVVEPSTITVIYDESCREMQQVMGSGERGPQGNAEQRPNTITVIELSDDEPEGDVQKIVDKHVVQNPNEVKWFYVDPQGQTQGPFPLFLLKQWSDANYFRSGFTVWESGHTSKDGVLLVDVLHRTFPF